MPKLVTKEIIKKIIELRNTGHSLSEIRNITGKPNSTVSKYIQGVNVLPAYKKILQIKQGGSKKRSEIAWAYAKKEANKIISNISKRDKIFLMLGLYWGEGTKRELNIINGDPDLIKAFIVCLKEIGVQGKDLRITLRIFEDMDSDKEVDFWAKYIGIPKEVINNVNILFGKKVGKLPHGMCRVRVAKAGKYFKLLMSMIDVFREKTLKPL